jgi:hypothetical protein
MSVQDKVSLGSLAIIAVVVGYLAYKVNKVVNNPDVQAAVAGGAQAVKETVNSVQDIARAAETGNAPPTGSAGSQNTSETAGISYLESVHDLVAHPIDSFKVMFGIGGD